jgi:hypothetical protein
MKIKPDFIQILESVLHDKGDLKHICFRNVINRMVNVTDFA